MNNYYAIDHYENYDMKTLSSQISCRNMSSLSKKYILKQNNLFSEKIKTDLCDKANYYDKNVDRIIKKEGDIIKGFSVNKKSCIYTRPIYENGDWVNQYNISDTYKSQMNSYKLFDYQSKAKVGNFEYI